MSNCNCCDRIDCPGSCVGPYTIYDTDYNPVVIDKLPPIIHIMDNEYRTTTYQDGSYFSSHLIPSNNKMFISNEYNFRFIMPGFLRENTLLTRYPIATQFSSQITTQSLQYPYGFGMKYHNFSLDLDSTVQFRLSMQIDEFDADYTLVTNYLGEPGPLLIVDNSSFDIVMSPLQNPVDLYVVAIDGYLQIPDTSNPDYFYDASYIARWMNVNNVYVKHLTQVTNGNNGSLPIVVDTSSDGFKSITGTMVPLAPFGTDIYNDYYYSRLLLNQSQYDLTTLTGGNIDLRTINKSLFVGVFGVVQASQISLSPLDMTNRGTNIDRSFSSRNKIVHVNSFSNILNMKTTRLFQDGEVAQCMLGAARLFTSFNSRPSYEESRTVDVAKINDFRNSCEEVFATFSDLLYEDVNTTRRRTVELTNYSCDVIDINCAGENYTSTRLAYDFGFVITNPTIDVIHIFDEERRVYYIGNRTWQSDDGVMTFVMLDNPINGFYLELTFLDDGNTYKFYNNCTSGGQPCRDNGGDSYIVPVSILKYDESGSLFEMDGATIYAAGISVALNP